MRPVESRGTSSTPLQPWRLQKALAYMDRHLAEPVALRALAHAAGLTSMHFAMLFRHATGMPPHQYLMRRRIQVAQVHLLRAELGILEISQLVGFRTQAHFTFVFKRFSGQPPLRWQAGMKTGTAENSVSDYGTG
jgi:AraC family transcriptional regulator